MKIAGPSDLNQHRCAALCLMMCLLLIFSDFKEHQMQNLVTHKE